MDGKHSSQGATRHDLSPARAAARRSAVAAAAAAGTRVPAERLRSAGIRPIPARLWAAHLRTARLRSARLRSAGVWPTGLRPARVRTAAGLPADGPRVPRRTATQAERPEVGPDRWARGHRRRRHRARRGPGHQFRRWAQRTGRQFR
ncbi:hypothetical protein MMUC44124_12160 [Mycolicibacterium mucogenicum DSM 44124]|nr:hypothetical protein MMUC44124_12160 [Mycolicibacterium mucogenicum DSM 44124]